MEFSKEKCAMFIVNSRKMVGIQLPNHERIITVREKENWKYLEVLKADTIKQAVMRKKTQSNKKRVQQKNKKILIKY